MLEKLLWTKAINTYFPPIYKELFTQGVCLGVGGIVGKAPIPNPIVRYVLKLGAKKVTRIFIRRYDSLLGQKKIGEEIIKTIINTQNPFVLYERFVHPTKTRSLILDTELNIGLLERFMEFVPDNHGGKSFETVKETLKKVGPYLPKTVGAYVKGAEGVYCGTANTIIGVGAQRIKTALNKASRELSTANNCQNPYQPVTFYFGNQRVND
jgi:hypothetical protein